MKLAGFVVFVLMLLPLWQAGVLPLLAYAAPPVALGSVVGLLLLRAIKPSSRV